MTFGEYIRHRRESLHLNQNDYKGSDQSYLSRIENGKYRPTKRDAFKPLADFLQIPYSQLDWLLTYSVLNKNPDEVFKPVNTVNNHTVAESQIPYVSNNNMNVTIIQIGDHEEDVRQKLGEPDRRIEVPATKSKWIYRADDLHIIFVNGRVNEVVFK